MNKLIKLTVLLFLTVLTLAGCYKPSFEYEAVQLGQLQGPSVDRNSEEYRKKYDTLGRYEETVKLDVAVCEFALEEGVKKGTTAKNQTFNKIAKDVLNIELNYVVIGNSTSYDQKLSLYLSSGKMPDMFYTTNSGLYSSLVEDGMLADLTESFWYLNDDLQENYLTYFPELLPTVMKDSNVYAFPTITNTYQSAQRLYIRQDWLDIVGMDAPTTMEEFVALGQAFIDHKNEIAAATGVPANRIIPFTMNKELTWSGSYSVEGFLNCFGTSINSYFTDANNNLYYSNTSQATKQAISPLRDMYSRGILDQQFLSSTAEDIASHIKSGYVGMAFGEWWMAKDVLDDCVNSDKVKNANWTWVDIPSAEGVDAKPIVKSVGVSGYNVVSKDCKHPEAAAKLINLFYDIYYSDDAQERYGSDVLPSNGFYYQFVPIKLWDGIASIREYKRVQEVFDNLYDLGFDPANFVDENTYKTNGLYQEVSSTQNGDLIVSVNDGKSTIVNRDVVAALNANPQWAEQFNTLRTREKTLHFVDGYPYFVAYKRGVALKDMSKAEKRGWGIYHEMIDPTGGYAYVVELTEGTKQAKYDCFYGANLSAMLEYAEYIGSQTDIMFTKMITGQMSMDEFESAYVEGVFNKNGGPTIMEQVNEWYKSHDIDIEYIYALVK